MHPTLFSKSATQTPLKQHAYTISQKYNVSRFRQIPPELMPLAGVVLFGVGFAGFAIVHHFLTDSQLRLKPDHGKKH